MSDLIHLPIGQHSFSNLRNRGYLYVDKTDLILRLIQEGDTYFLGRPRRMGKSLLVSTLEAIFEGRRELFDGLAIAASGYDFMPHPVVRLDFGMVSAESLDIFKSNLCMVLNRIAIRSGLKESKYTHPNEILIEIVQTLEERDKVVLLIDEYDKPLVGNIEDPEQTQLFLKFLKGFYETVKGLQPSLRFTFITGVSRFANTSIFSGMNNLDDLSMDHQYAALLGITEAEIARYLLPYFQRLSAKRKQSLEELRELVRCWYNGYRFAGDSDAPAVYNPHSLFSFLKKERLTNYWFRTGTPTFAVKLIRQKHSTITEFETGLAVSDSFLESSFEIDDIPTVPLLFQSGYLTITDYDSKSHKYTLGFPNEEVRRSFFESLSALFFKTSLADAQRMGQEIIQGVKSGKVEPIIQSFNSLLGQLSHHLLRRDEAYYHSMAYMMLRSIGLAVETEKPCCKGRLDMGLRIGNKAYVFEFKRDSNAAEALRQIHDKQYARAYVGEGLDIYLVGINVNSESCAIDDWIVEAL